jgi:hypothetical protein
MTFKEEEFGGMETAIKICEIEEHINKHNNI